MLLHRSMNETEFRTLLSGKPVIGRYNVKNQMQSSFEEEGLYVCFFEDDYWWIDANHKICAIVDIPEEKLGKGFGTYFASKNMAKTHIWSGRRGSELYLLNECYAKSYSIEDVVSISLPHWTDTALKPYKEQLGSMNIDIMVRPDILIKETNLKRRLSTRFKKYVNMPKTSLHESFKEYLRNICLENGYTGTIEIDCWDNSRVSYAKSNNIITSIELDLFSKDNKNFCGQLRISYPLELKKEMLQKLQNGENLDLSKFLYSGLNYRQPHNRASFKGDLFTLSQDLVEKFL